MQDAVIHALLRKILDGQVSALGPLLSHTGGQDHRKLTKLIGKFIDAMYIWRAGDYHRFMTYDPRSTPSRDRHWHEFCSSLRQLFWRYLEEGGPSKVLDEVQGILATPHHSGYNQVKPITPSVTTTYANNSPTTVTPIYRED